MTRSVFVACPKCDAVDMIRVSILEGAGVLVTCKRCFAPGEIMGSGDDREEARAVWNARATAAHKLLAVASLSKLKTNIGRLALLVRAGYTAHEAGTILRSDGWTVPSGAEVRA